MAGKWAVDWNAELTSPGSGETTNRGGSDVGLSHLERNRKSHLASQGQSRSLRRMLGQCSILPTLAPIMLERARAGPRPARCRGGSLLDVPLSKTLQDTTANREGPGPGCHGLSACTLSSISRCATIQRTPHASLVAASGVGHHRSQWQPAAAPMQHSSRSWRTVGIFSVIDLHALTG